MTDQEETDKNLVIRAQNGDEEAFRQLVERYQRKVYSIAYGVVRNREDALDLTQDAFIKIHRNLPNFKGTSSFYTWLYRIVVNLGIDHKRKTSRVHSVDYDDTIKREEDQGGGGDLAPSRMGTNPSKVMRRKELARQMQAALETLSDNHRTAILLREVHGMSYEEMAEAMNVSKGTVMSRLHHARKNMQKALQGYLDGTLGVE
ncbi:MAG: RNA polymerase subunit sigma [Myxococcales bacterium]|nr:RNA polymerase subunit sigma [Myxococcales bacterium]